MTSQVWPDDAFDAGATPYGTTPRRWLRVLPWTTQPEAATGQQLRCTFATLHNRRQVGEEGGAAAAADDGTPDRLACFVDRAAYLLEGEVMLTPRFFATPAPTQDSWRGVALLARVSGGTLTQPGGDFELEGMQGVSCYLLVEAKQAAGVRRLSLLKVAAGTPTLLQQVQVATIDPDVAADQLADARRLRLVVTDGGGGAAEIEAFRVVRDANGRLVEVNAFGTTIVDGSGLPAGRFGFGIQVERLEAGGPVNVTSAMLADLVRIRSADGATTYLRDLFRRTVPAAARIVVNLGGTIGRSLMQAFGGDAEGLAEGLGMVLEFRGQLREVSGSNLVRLGASPAGIGFSGTQPFGWYPWQDPASSSDRRWIVTCTLLGGAAASQAREFGVFVRGGFLPALTGGVVLGSAAGISSAPRDDLRTGYLVALVFVPGGSPAWSLELRHFEGSTLPTYVATVLARADVDGAGLALGTALELDVEVRNESDQGQSAPSLRVELNGQAPTWEIPESVLGVAAIDGRVYDLRSVATLDGAADGLYLRAGAHFATGLVDVDRWRRGALSAPPPPQDEPTVALPSEVDGAVGALELPATWSVTELHELAVVRHDHDDGTQTLHAAQPRGRRRWAVRSTGASLAELDVLRGFFVAHRANVLPFDWTTREGEAVVVRFASDVLGWTTRSARPGPTGRVGAGDVAFELEEALDASVWNGGAL